MNRRAIPNHQQFSRDVPQQMAQKADNPWTTESFVLHLHQDAPACRQRADGRQMIPGERDAQDRGLATWGKRPRHEEEQRARRLVYEEDRALLGLGFAERAGQVWSRHAAIAASSRWLARRIGFCTLSPSCRSRRLICAGW